MADEKLEKIGARAVCAEDRCRCEGGCELGRRTFRAALQAIEDAGYELRKRDETALPDEAQEIYSRWRAERQKWR